MTRRSKEYKADKGWGGLPRDHTHFFILTTNTPRFFSIFLFTLNFQLGDGVRLADILFCSLFLLLERERGGGGEGGRETSFMHRNTHLRIN